MRWFLSNGGDTVGPVDDATVRQWLAAGSIGPGTHIRDEQAAAWTIVAQSPFASFLPKAPLPTKKGQISPRMSALIIVGGSILVTAALVGNQGQKNEPPPAVPVNQKESAQKEDKVDKVDAWVMAQTFVKRGLKSPGSANFGGIFSEHQSTDEAVTKIDDKTYSVTGWVDSQNGFGALVRSNFSIKLVYHGGGRWEAIEGPEIVSR